MQYLGEIISLGVAALWTVGALANEVSTRRLGVFVMNVWRMALTLLLSAGLMACVFGVPYPAYADGQAWAWLLLSGVVGYFFGDWCLFNCYLSIGSRVGQLFLALAPMFTALAAWAMIGQTLTWSALLAMCVTLSGIAVSVLGRDGGTHRLALRLPLRGILFGLGAAVGQGVGLVLSKVGLDRYAAGVPAEVLPAVGPLLPFGANMIRCVAGFVCFGAWLALSGQAGRLRRSLSERRGLGAMVIAVLCGPFVGVGFSLMAVQYTAAGIASTLMALTPILILLPSRWLFGQPVTLRALVGAVISVLGVSLFFLL